MLKQDVVVWIINQKKKYCNENVNFKGIVFLFIYFILFFYFTGNCEVKQKPCCEHL
jgi:hypothetical protein